MGDGGGGHQRAGNEFLEVQDHVGFSTRESGKRAGIERAMLHKYLRRRRSEIYRAYRRCGA